MKKILTIIAVFTTALAFTSCSNDKDVNTENVTIAFENSALAVKENKGLFYVPIVADGKQNGPIELDIEIIENDPQCKKDVNFLVTSTHLIMPQAKNEDEVKKVNVEIMAIDDRVINPDRTFQLRIVRAKGAAISNTAGCVDITMTDNDNIPYERMSGTWIVEATNMLSETGNVPVTWTTTLTTIDDENDPSYMSTITMSPWQTWDGQIPTLDQDGWTLSHPLTFHYNETTKVATVDLALGTIMASGLDFGEAQGGVSLTNCTIRSATQGITGQTYSGVMVGTVSPDFDEIKFSLPVMGIIFTQGGTPYQYMFAYNNITMKLKK